MKTCPILLSILFTFLISANMLAADDTLKRLDTLTLDMQPDTIWQLQMQEPGVDKVQLKEAQGCLEIDYDVNVNGQYQVTNRVFNQKSFFLILKKPIAVTPQDSRVLFETLGSEMRHPHDRTNQVMVSPVLMDEHDERLVYVPDYFPQLKPQSPGWHAWMTSAFYTTEAGGAAQDIYEAFGGDNNAWPDGKLHFVGFRVDVRRNEPGQKKGSIFLSNIALAPIKIKVNEPYFYADNVLKDEGTYTLAATVRNTFQATPVSETITQIKFDPNDQNARRQRVAIELGPNDNYWINYQIRDAKGDLIDQDVMRYQVIGSDVTKTLAPVDVSKAPVSGNMRINPLANTQGVYEPGQPMDVTVRLFPKGLTGLTLQWELLQCLYPGHLDGGAIDVPAGNKPFQDLRITRPWMEGRNAYQLKITVKQGPKRIDEQIYFLGRKTDITQQYNSRQGMILDRDYVKKFSYNRTTFIYYDGFKPSSEDQALDFFKQMCDQTSTISRYMTYMIDLRDFEVLPGVFDFALLDKVMDAAADRGMALTIRYAHTDRQGMYRWLKYLRQHSSEGMEISEPSYGGFSLTDERVVEMWMQAYKATALRYANHPGFQGFYLMQPAGETVMQDQPWAGVVAGYDPTIRPMFTKYLREILGLSLEQVNKRWGKAYHNWDEIDLPMPWMDLGAVPDLRMQWVDFNTFKEWLKNEYWFVRAARAIREYDKNHVLIVYSNVINPNLQGLVDYGHNGGNQYKRWEGLMVNAWDQHKSGWITEPHHPHRWAAYGDPAMRGWVLDWSIWVMTAQAGAGGANLHVYYMPKPDGLVAKFGGAYSYDRFVKYQPILNELHDMKLIQNKPQVAAMLDKLTLYTKHRTTFAPRLDDLSRFFELLKSTGVGFDLVDDYKMSLDGYKLVITNPLDEVLSEQRIVELDSVVRNEGAKAIVCAYAGRYCPQRDGVEFPLLKQLGIDAPKGQYIRDGVNVTAKVTEENPLFDKDSQLAFFTQADQQAALASDMMKRQSVFWNWPFRWIPRSDYFGYYGQNMNTNGKVLARFANGAVALSEHKVGKGEVIVFWGTPNYTIENYPRLMPNAVKWAGVHDPNAGNPVPFTLEGRNEQLKRHYVLMYQETPGTYQQGFANVADGEYFLDDMVTDQRLGLFTGKQLREHGPKLTWDSSYSPLKIIRCIPRKEMRATWDGLYGGMDQ